MLGGEARVVGCAAVTHQAADDGVVHSCQKLRLCHFAASFRDEPAGSLKWLEASAFSTGEGIIGMDTEGAADSR